MLFGAPLETTEANILFIFLSAIPTNWLGSFFYPTDRAEPTPEQAVRFSRKKDIYRAAILFTYRWLYGTPFNIQFFFADFMMSYGVGALIGERPAGTRQRRSEFGVALLWVAGSAVLMQFAPPMLSFWITVADRAIWRSAYIALVDDVVGVLAKPNMKTWKGKVTLVLTQACTIVFLCWLLLSWRRDMMVAEEASNDYNAALAALNVGQDPVEVGGNLEDDGDRYLV